MKPPPVSVIIPVRDRYEYLPEAIESVQLQSHEGAVEIVVVDDGSQRDVATLYRGRFPSVTWLRQPPRGVCAARQAGAERARFELLAYLDDDDLWLPEKLRVQATLLAKRADVELAWCDVRFFSDDWEGNPFYAQSGLKSIAGEETVECDAPAFVFPAGTLLDYMVGFEPLFPGAVILRRSFLARIGGWNTDVLGCGDCHDITARAFSAGTVAFQDSVLVRGRRGHAHMTLHGREAELESLEVFDGLRASYRPELRDRLRGPLGRRFAGYGWHCYSEGRFGLATRAYRRAVGLGCTEPRVLARWCLAAARSALK